MAQIKNSHLAIQISKNQIPIFFQLSVKMIIAFCSVWTFFGYKWVIDPGSKIKRSQFRLALASLFQKPLIIPSDHLFDFGPVFKCHTQRMERIGFPEAGLYAKSFEKKNLLKKTKYCRSSPSCNWRIFLIISKGKIFRADQKRNPYIVNNWRAGVSKYTIHYFGDHKDFYISSLFYFSFVIDNAKPTCLDCVNSNIYSCLLSLLKLHGAFWFMN